MSAESWMLRICYATDKFNQSVSKEEREPLPVGTAIYRFDTASASWMAAELQRVTKRSALSAAYLYAALGGIPVKRAADLIEHLQLAEMAHEKSGDHYNAAYHVKRFAVSAGAEVDGEIYLEEWQDMEEAAH